MSIKIKNIKNGKTIIHCTGTQGADYALCGHDTAGDEALGWGGGIRTAEKVNCQSCIDIIEFCQLLPKTIISKNPITIYEWDGQ